MSNIKLEDLTEFFRSKKLLKKHHIKKIGIFGSITKSDHPNDIDLLVGEFEDYKDLINLKDELEKLTGKNIDIVIEKFANPIILHRAKKDIRYVA